MTTQTASIFWKPASNHDLKLIKVDASTLLSLRIWSLQDWLHVTY